MTAPPRVFTIDFRFQASLDQKKIFGKRSEIEVTRGFQSWERVASAVSDAEPGKFFFPHLETGDALALEGGPEGVVHDVGFYGDAARKGWRKRLSVVAFYAVGARKTRSARTSAASAG